MIDDPNIPVCQSEWHRLPLKRSEHGGPSEGRPLIIGGEALWLGSAAAALVGVGVYLASTCWRIMIEERDLRARLPTYAAYARRVRGRLIPFLL